MTGDGGDGGGCSTPMSLPVPGFSLLYESNSQAINKFARHAYAGIRPGEGPNLRSTSVHCENSDLLSSPAKKPVSAMSYALLPIP